MTFGNPFKDTVGQPVLNNVRALRDRCVSSRLWRPIYKHRALPLVLVAAFCSALESILARYVKEDVHAMQVSFTRYLFQLLPPISVLTYTGVSPKAESKSVFTFLIIRGVVGVVGVTSFYYALYFTSVGNATAVVYGAPVFVVFFARIILKEAIGVIDAVLVVVVIGGVILISQPPFIFGKEGEGDASKEVSGALMALFSSISFALAITSTAKMGKLDVNSFKIVLYYAVVASITTALLATSTRVWSIPPCGLVRLVLVSMGILNCGLQCLLTYSLTIEKPIFVIIVQTNEVIFAYVLEFLLFNASPDVFPLIGTGLIVSGSLTASWRKIKVSTGEQNKN